MEVTPREDMRRVERQMGPDCDLGAGAKEYMCTWPGARLTSH